MISIEPKIRQELDVDIVTSDGRNINDILEEISWVAHDRLLMASMDRQELEDKKEDSEPEDTINTLESIIEYLESGFCRILDELKD